MPSVADPDNGEILALAYDEAYAKFLNEWLFGAKPLCRLLQDTVDHHSEDIENYLKWRIAEVDPGFVLEQETG